MAHIVYYENPSSAECAKHKAELLACGHEVDARDLTREAWSVSSLRPYFGERPVRDWFNPAAPKVRSGEIRFDELTPQMALVMMILDPCLINAPLLRIGSHCEVGYDPARLARYIVAPAARPH
jgi:nitrogenase-associated protein